MLIKVLVNWSGQNFNGGWSYEGFGAIIVTSRTLESFKKDFEEALTFQIEGMIEDGLDIPAFLANGEYKIEYDLETAALLREAESFTTMAALSRTTGINAKLLSHYANGLKKPRKEQRRRIVEGLHAIGRRALALM